MSSKTPRCSSEDFESELLVRWLLSNGWECLHQDTPYNGGPLFSHIAHSGKLSRAASAKFKRMGKASGVPDYLIQKRDRSGWVWVELKKKKGGRVSNEQKIWLQELGECSRVCLGADSAIEYLEGL